MEEVNIHLSLPRDGVGGIEKQKEYNHAKKLLDQNDAKELFRHYERQVIKNSELTETFLKYSELKVGSSSQPLLSHDYRVTPDVVAAMKDVALAAIELAKTFADKK